MAITIGTQANIDKSDLTNYPNGQIKDNTGTGDGTPINRLTASDIWEFFDKVMRLAGISFNNTFDNETNGYQYVQALIALASKSDYVLALTTVSGVINITTKLSILQNNEKLLCQPNFDYSTETSIIGSDSVTKTLSNQSGFKNGDYLLLINNGGNIKIVRLATKDNINQIVGESNYLKAASNTDELTGTAVNAATTPASNKYAFTQRVTDPTNAAPFLVTPTTPGIMSAADKTKLNALSNVRNLGNFDGFDPGGGTVGNTFTVSGDITNAIITNVEPISGGYGGSTTVRCTMANAMANTNYFVRSMLQSEGASIQTDNNMFCPVFKPITTTTFDWSLQEGVAGVQTLKVHLEVVQLS